MEATAKRALSKELAAIDRQLGDATRSARRRAARKAP